MCGLVGFVDSSPQGGYAPGDTVRSMAHTLVHRGPDDEGYWADDSTGLQLGFRRLAILDLSQAGHQPMTSSSGRWVICYNGEVYNFRDLRRTLDPGPDGWRGDSDTEVILAAVEAWGPHEALQRMRGMFAVALYDTRERELWLARDRMGIKPLYLAQGAGWLVFGSELRALAVHPRVGRRGSRAAAWSYLRTLYVPTPRAILEGVEKVQPGAVLRFRLGVSDAPRRSDGRFWSLPDVAASEARRPHDSPEQALEEGLELLRESVRLRLVADVPVGALLSGGVDSSLVVALMAEQADAPVRTFTVRFGDARFDEGPVAAAVADVLGTRHTEVALPGTAVGELVPELADFADEPTANPSILPTLLVCRVAREDVVVALSGDGGDELFGGYNRYRSFPRLWGAAGVLPTSVRRLAGGAMRAMARGPGAEALGGLLQRGSFGDQHSFTARLHRAASIVGGASAAEAYVESMAVGLIDPPLDPPAEGAGGIPPVLENHPGSLLARVMLADQMEYLPDDLLAKVDRASMWTSLEARVPILDHRVVEYSWRLPDAWKIRDGVAKWPLRALAARYIPASVLDRPKMGFTVPLEQWLRHDLREWVGDLLDADHIRRRGLYDVEAVVALRDRFLGGAPGLAAPIWTLAVLEDWCERRGVTF
ncbi:MAG: asparagine synthase (glutamine-hydrolyzing) [Longimicrobiales bacterium]